MTDPKETQIAQFPPRVRPDRGAARMELIAVGRDLLRGRVPESNTHRLAESLTDIGGVIERIVIVDDDVERIATAIRESLGRNPTLVIVTGGLGPAPDDRTFAGVSDAISKPLTEIPAARRQVEDAYRRLAENRQVAGAGMTLAREKVCRLPVGSIVIENRLGIAPGAICRLAGGTAVVCLPGRPREMQAVWEAAREELTDLLPRAIAVHREVESPTLDEAELRPILEEIARDHPGVWVSSHPSGARRRDPKITITLESVAPSRQIGVTRLELALKRLLALAGGAR